MIMEQNFIEIEGVQVDSEALFYLILCGTMKAQMEATDNLTAKKRTKFLSSCVEYGKAIMNRLEDINNPKQ